MPSREKHERDQLVEEHLPLARALARRFRGRGEPLDDLQQVAAVALLGAANRFDEERGTNFAAFAMVSVLGELKRYFRDRSWWVRAPRPVHDMYLASGEARTTLEQRLGRSPTIAEIAVYLDTTAEDVLEALEAVGCYRPGSLDHASSPEAPTPLELLPALGDEYEAALDRRRLSELLPTLSDSELYVVKAYYFDDRTQDDISKDLGVSQMQVSRMLSSVRRRLRDHF